MNKKTKTLTTEQYKEIIQTMREGFSGCRPNERIATALVLEGNLGLRISDILKLRLCDIVRDGDRYRLEIMEQKTGKRRIFTVPLVLYQYIENYCLRNGIRRTDTIFTITERMVQKQLHIVCDYLGYEGISTHSFRKWYATEILTKNQSFPKALPSKQFVLTAESSSTTDLSDTASTNTGRRCPCIRSTFLDFVLQTAMIKEKQRRIDYGAIRQNASK